MQSRTHSEREREHSSTHHHRTEALLQGSGGAWSQRRPYPACAAAGSNEATETICDLCNGFLREDGHLQAHTHRTKHHSRGVAGGKLGNRTTHTHAPKLYI